MSRPKFQTRKILLRSEVQRDNLLALIPNLPMDNDKPLEIVIREEVKVRGLDQNALMWVGPLDDIEKQAWVHGRQYSAEVWHEYFKEEFLPEDYDEELTKEGYCKWDYGPDGKRRLIGSTKQLTKKGFSQYLNKVEAHAATEYGVQFGAGRQAAA